MKLNDPIVKAAKPKEKPYKLTDGHGLILLINPNGRKWWRYRYDYGGKEKMLSLGVYPEVTLQEARQGRNEARALLKQGIDPSQHRQEKKYAEQIAREQTFERIGRAWWENWKSDKTTYHSNAVLRRLELNVFPLIGHKPITVITAPTIVMAIRRIDARGAPDLARRIFQTCGQIFSYAISHGFIERNPCADVRPSDIVKPVKTTHYARIGEQDLPLLIRAIDEYGGSVLVKKALRLLLLTFVRSGELIGARWDEIDWDARLWRIPPERMKKRDPYVIPLSTQALAIFKELGEITGSGEYVFPNKRNNDRCMGDCSLRHALYSMGYKGLMTAHGFRGLAATILNERKYPEKIIEIQLSHLVGNATKRAYDHAKHLPERAQMMQDWADFLEEQDMR